MRSPNRDAEVVIIGAGIIGAALAHRLAEHGCAVTVVDAGAQVGGGSTSASSGIIRFHYASFESAAMAWDSYPAWRDWAGEIGAVDPGGHPQYVPTGGLLLGAVEEFAPMARNLTRLGITHEVLDPDDLRHRFPGLDPRRFGPPTRPDDPAFWAEPAGDELHGLYTPDAGYVADPQRAAASYAWAAAGRGAVFRMRSRVVGVEARNDGSLDVLFEDGGRRRAGVVVNAAGPGSAAVNRAAGLEGAVLPTRPLRVETHAVAAPSSFRGPTSVFVLDPDLGIAFRPDGTEDLHLSSIEPECDPLHWAADPWLDDPRPTRGEFELRALRAARRLPELTVPSRVRGTSALYDVSPDWVPLLGRTRLPGFLVACGTSGNSFKTAPAIAHVMRAMVEATLRDEEPPAEVALPATGTVISTAAFDPMRSPGPARNVVA